MLACPPAPILKVEMDCWSFVYSWHTISSTWNGGQCRI